MPNRNDASGTRLWTAAWFALLLCLAGCSSLEHQSMDAFSSYTLNFDTPTDAALQRELEAVDARLRARFGIAADETATGVLDLRRPRLAMVRPDAIDYAASVPKVAILLAWFALNPGAATQLSAETRQELGMMIKVSDNALAAKYSQQLGLRRIQEVLDSYDFYDARRGGGIWLGKHYGKGGERYGDPIANHSHAATVRQILRFYLLLEQRRLVSPAASEKMREIFASPDITHLEDKFVKGLAGRDVQVLRKSGWWENWSHDSAIITGPNRHYILVAMTRHPRGEDYLQAFACAVDDLMIRENR